MSSVLQILSLHISYENVVFLPSVQPKVMFGENHKKGGTACNTCFSCKYSELKCKIAFFFLIALWWKLWSATSQIKKKKFEGEEMQAVFIADFAAILV